MANSAPHPRIFQAAVERPLSVVFQSADGRWEGHDYRVEVIAEAPTLDGFDVVVDFRDLEAALDALLAPLDGCCLTELSSPNALAEHLLAELSPKVASPARLAEVALTDGRGRRLALRP